MMNRVFKLSAVLILLSMVTLPVFSQDTVEDLREAAENPRMNDSEFAVAVALSETLSSSTGVAMSPLLGMGALGAWKYFRTEGAARAALPWYSAPWIWGICFGIFLLLKSKDTLGAFIPEIAKKPITVVDDIQEKASAAIVALAVIPPAVLDHFDSYQAETAAPGAVVPVILPVVMVVVCVTVFIIVWFVFNAFSSIKVFSPSSMINSAISVVKGVILAGFTLLAALNPFVGLAVSLLIIVGCALIFGWAFRWNVFGILFAKDFLTGSFEQEWRDGERLMGFSTGNLPGVPARTYGEILRENDDLVFTWRTWLVGPKKRCRVHLEDVEASVRKGIFLPSIIVRTKSVERARSIVDLRMRNRTHHEEVRQRLQLESVSENLVFSGFRASWLWVKEQLNRGGTALSKALETEMA